MEISFNAVVGAVLLMVWGVAFGALIIWQRKQNVAYRAAVDAHPRLRMVSKTRERWFGYEDPHAIALRNHPISHALHEHSTGGKHPAPLWRFVADIGLRTTTLTVSREGALGGIREALGFQDVHIGHDAFDRLFTVRGSNPDLVRGLLRSPGVKVAIYQFFENPAVTTLSVDDGQMTIITGRKPSSPAPLAEIESRLDACVALAEALHAARNAEPMFLDEPAAPTRTLDSVSASSGSPIAVPGFKVRG